MDALVIADVAAAYVLDLILGDPPRLPHPVRFIGWLTAKTEILLRRRIDKTASRPGADRARAERTAGTGLTLIVVSATFLLVYGLLAAAHRIGDIWFHALNIYFIYTSFAARCMADEAIRVQRLLQKDDLPEARKRVGMLVGRETQNLDAREVTRAVVETTAENTVDGVLSPILYAVLGSFFGIGAPLVYAFKAASTLDSMVGYMNERYLHFGRTSAKLDDALNYLPARLSGVLIPLSAFLCGKGFKRSFRIMLRDRRNHKSPNCAYPEAAVAGALGVRLGGNSVYFGKTVEKPGIGDGVKELEPRDIAETVRIMFTASFLTLSAGLLLLGVFMRISS